MAENIESLAELREYAYSKGIKNVGRKYTQELCNMVKIPMIEYYIYDTYVREEIKISVPVLQYDCNTGLINGRYKSIHSAGKMLGIKKGNISLAIKWGTPLTSPDDYEGGNPFVLKRKFPKWTSNEIINGVEEVMEKMLSSLE